MILGDFLCTSEYNVSVGVVSDNISVCHSVEIK